MARFFQLFDVLNKLGIEVLFSPYRVTEKPLAVEHSEKMGADDLVLLVEVKQPSGLPVNFGSGVCTFVFGIQNSMRSFTWSIN